MRIGIDIGGSHIAIGLINEQGNVIKKIEQDIQITENVDQYIIHYVDKVIQDLREIEDISYIGIAAPGNPKGAVVTNLVNLGLKSIDFHIIEEKYHIKIKSINDAKAAALAEKKYGAIKEFRDAVFLCLGTGIGGAVFFNHALLQASRNPGFELGHMVIERNGNPCNCGKNGCFETYCSMKRFKENIVKVLQEIDVNVSEEDSLKIVEELKKNIENEKISQFVNTYIDDFVIGLSNIIDIFEPEGIALGGSFVYFKDILYQRLIDTMEEKRYVFNKGSLPKIKLAEFKNDAGLIGATLL